MKYCPLAVKNFFAMRIRGLAKNKTPSARPSFASAQIRQMAVWTYNYIATLIIRTEMIPKTMVVSNRLIWLLAPENFINKNNGMLIPMKINSITYY